MLSEAAVSYSCPKCGHPCLPPAVQPGCYRLCASCGQRFKPSDAVDSRHELVLGEVLYRGQRKWRWRVMEIDRTPDFSAQAAWEGRCGDKTGPLRALLRREWDHGWCAWFPVAELDQLGFRRTA